MTGGGPVDMSTMVRALATILVLWAAVPVAAQDETTRRPLQAGRVVRVFDFEERETNPLPVPRSWVRAQDDPAAGRMRPGFPIFNRAFLDYSVAFRGEGSLAVPTKGGSTAVRLEAGAVNVFPEADYLVAARVRTRGVKRARAALYAEILDSQERPIVSGRSDLVRSDGDEWKTVMVTMRGGTPGAAYLRIEALLLQPREFTPPVLGRHHVWEEDLGAVAWFDDVTVIQLPRMVFGTRSTANIVVAPETPELLVEVRDLAGQALRAQVLVQDIDGREADADEYDLAPGTSVHRFRPDVSAFGWYRATLTLYTGDLRVGTRYVDFLYMPPFEPGHATMRDRARLGLTASNIPDEMWGVLPDVVRASGVGSASLPIWTESTRASDLPGLLSRIHPVVDRLESMWVTPSFVLARAPEELRGEAIVDPDDPLGVLELPGKAWAPYLVPFLDRFGQSVKRWQIGPDGSARAGTRPSSSAAAAGAEIAQLVPGPTIALGLRVDQEIDPAIFAPGSPVGAVSWFVPASVPDAGIPLLARTWEDLTASGVRPGLWLVLGTLDVERFGARSTVIDCARKAILAWVEFNGEGQTVLALHEPWTWTGGSEAQFMPGPTLGLWRTLHDHLNARRFAGWIDLGPGVKCLALAPEPGSERAGALVLWRDAPGRGHVRAFLGPGEVEAVDVFSNRARVERTGATSTGPGEHVIPVSESPVFLEGVDINMIRFVSSLRLEPGFVESDADRHAMGIRLENPWGVRIEGRLMVTEPGGLGGVTGERNRTWRISPRTIPFSIAPGASATLPFWMSFSAGEEAGTHRFAVEMDLVADRDYKGLSVSTTFEIGIRELELDLSYRLGEGDTLLVEARLTNRGSLPGSYRLLAFAPGHPRQDASVMDLEPGSTVVRRFVLSPAAGRGGAGALTGESIIVSAIDLDRGRRLNRSIGVE